MLSATHPGSAPGDTGTFCPQAWHPQINEFCHGAWPSRFSEPPCCRAAGRTKGGIDPLRPSHGGLSSPESPCCRLRGRSRFVSANSQKRRPRKRGPLCCESGLAALFCLNNTHTTPWLAQSPSRSSLGHLCFRVTEAAAQGLLGVGLSRPGFLQTHLRLQVPLARADGSCSRLPGTLSVSGPGPPSGRRRRSRSLLPRIPLFKVGFDKRNAAPPKDGIRTAEEERGRERKVCRASRPPPPSPSLSLTPVHLVLLPPLSCGGACGSHSAPSWPQQVVTL